MQEDIFENQVFTFSVHFLNCMTAGEALAELVKEMLVAFFLDFSNSLLSDY